MREVRFSVGHWIFLLGIVTLATTVHAVWTHYSPVPYGDQWDGTIGFYLRALQDPWRAFFEQHNGHRLIFSRLLFFADVRYFGGRNVLLLAANLLLAGLLALAFYHIAVRHGAPKNRDTHVGLIGLILILAFSWIQQENFTWGFQSQWFAVYLFALMAFHSLELAADACKEGHTSKSRTLLATALLGGTTAAFSMANGLLAFPVLFLQALYLRLRPRTVWLIATLSLIVWGAYFLPWRKSPGNGRLLASLYEQPLDVLSYVLMYLGAPAYYAGLDMVGARLAGIVVLATLASSMAKAMQQRARQQPLRAIAPLAFALFVVGGALITVCGRLESGIGSALQSRYATASLAIWLALIVSAALNAKTESSWARESRLLAATVAALIVASGQRFTADDDHDVIHARLLAGLALRSHVYDPQVTQVIYPSAKTLVAIAQAAEQAKISIFSPDQPDYSVPPPHIDATSICDGAMTKVVATTTPGTYQAEGWIHDITGSRIPREVIVTDAVGMTLGTGLTGEMPDDVLSPQEPTARLTGWIAYFRTTSLTRLQVVAPQPDGSYCKMQSPAAPQGARLATSQGPS
ncbi:hypothetical protein CJO94_15815 [Ralstonia solanacearum]|nr:hypothetical protein CJO94_15815 [Ralstonia solanacearum]